MVQRNLKRITHGHPRKIIRGNNPMIQRHRQQGGDMLATAPNSSSMKIRIVLGMQVRSKLHHP
ncbi:hypothetical protein CCASEI_01290 [Corynebacterium casei LMG S-19264]|uniref:Uncharacterized protein n=1 Tax=Corynebacterium casei LMG S-19264 TaxID=1285583 RepID=A0ABM5PLV2_9CORY|nr:hypothetical protein CCASEI_01210 [Corynebacterium casei LMG S-19264]AHI18843.1 hypothetical protein CCASEI_01290 [Corynebacterium casei LMG S-19264]